MLAALIGQTSWQLGQAARATSTGGPQASQLSTGIAAGRIGSQGEMGALSPA
jgi:hypothetical protein